LALKWGVKLSDSHQKPFQFDETMGDESEQAEESENEISSISDSSDIKTVSTIADKECISRISILRKNLISK